MRYVAIGNSTFEGSISSEYIRSIIRKAVEFLCAELNCNASHFNLHCIISLKYDEDVRNYHVAAGSKENTSNAMFIPPFYQKNPTNQAIIIFNWVKIRRGSESFITSVFVHEFAHYHDYLLCPQLENEFGSIFFLGVKENSIPDIIGGEFDMRSEMRAKYFQEKYECSLCSSGEEILLRMQKCQTKVTSSIDFYNIAQLSGQFRCWKELSQQYPIILDCVAKLEEYLENLFAENPPSNYLLVFSETDFWEECRRFYKEANLQNDSCH